MNAPAFQCAGCGRICFDPGADLQILQMDGHLSCCPDRRMLPAITVQDLQFQVFDFAQSTFGPDREDAAWKKLFEELGETLKNPDDPSEWADVFIILLDLAKLYKIDVGQATVAKMAVNRTRTWTTTKTGVMQHVPDAVPESLAPAHTFSHWALYEGGPCMGGPIRVEGNSPNQYRPANHEGRGGYYLAHVDTLMDKRILHVYKWDPSMEVPF